MAGRRHAISSALEEAGAYLTELAEEYHGPSYSVRATLLEPDGDMVRVRYELLDDDIVVQAMNGLYRRFKRSDDPGYRNLTNDQLIAATVADGSHSSIVEDMITSFEETNPNLGEQSRRGTHVT